MMNGHLLACATLGKVIVSASSDAESHSQLMQVSLFIYFCAFLFLLE